MKALLFMLALAQTEAATAVDGPLILPKDVQIFIEQRDGCEHFMGEEPYDKARRRYLAKMMRELCTGTDNRLAALRAQYAGDPPVLDALASYDARIEN